MNAVPRAKFTAQDSFRQWTLHQPLDGLPHRPRPERLIEATRAEQVLYHLRAGDVFDALLGSEATAAVRQEFVRNCDQVRFRQGCESKPFVDPVPKLGRKQLAHRFCAL